MGFTNYLPATTYAAIDDIMYYKENRMLRFHLKLYTDSKREVMLASREIIFNASSYAKNVLGISNTPPTPSSNKNDYWIIGDSPTGEWIGYEHTVANFENGFWRYWSWGKGETFFYVPLNGHCYFDDNGQIKKANASQIQDIEFWDKWFSSQSIASGGSNLHRQIYLYLRQFPEFATVKDC
jgi:hypothetical protein